MFQLFRNFFNDANYARDLIVIEHVICRLKKYRIMSEIFRNSLRKYDMVSDIVNYRIMNSI